MDKEPITIEGLKKLKIELEDLKNNKRPKVVAAIAEARGHGDLKENAEYHAAREQQSFNEGRIQEIESRMADAQIIDVSKIAPTGKVIFGTTVTLIACDTEETIRYHIVGEDEAALKQDKISVLSPIARALIGKMEDEVVNVVTPGGEREFEVSAVEHLS